MINYLEILVAAIAGVAVGFVWFGPLFGKLWIRLSNLTQEQMDAAKAKGMTKNYIFSFVFSFVMAYVLAHFINLIGVATFSDALSLSFWIWLGFIVTTMVNSVLWEGKPMKLFFLNIGHQLLTLIVMASIITLW